MIVHVLVGALIALLIDWAIFERVSNVWGMGSQSAESFDYSKSSILRKLLIFLVGGLIGYLIFSSSDENVILLFFILWCIIHSVIYYEMHRKLR